MVCFPIRCCIVAVGISCWRREKKENWDGMGWDGRIVVLGTGGYADGMDGRTESLVKEGEVGEGFEDPDRWKVVDGNGMGGVEEEEMVEEAGGGKGRGRGRVRWFVPGFIGRWEIFMVHTFFGLRVSLGEGFQS